MGRFSSFLRLCAILFVSFFAIDAFGAGYTCPASKQYTSCNAGYYLSGTGVGNSCVVCPVGYYCPGGTYTAPYDCDNGSTTASSSNIWTTNGTGKTARSQCYRNVVISRKYNGGNSSAYGTLNVLNPVTGVTAVWSSGDLTIQAYYDTAFTLPASSGLTFDDGSWYEFGGWATVMANSTYGSNSKSTDVTVRTTSTAASQTYYPVIKAKSTITLDCQGCDTPGTASLYAIYANGMYLDSAYSKMMTASANPITIPVKMGYNFGGYYKSSGCSGNQIINANGYFVTEPRAYADTALYACWSAKSYSCSAGTYLPAGATTCATCIAGYYCPGSTSTEAGAYYFNPNANVGIYECTGYTYSAAGASVCSTTSSGYYATGGTTCTNSGARCTSQTQCEGGYYCTAGQKYSCPNPMIAVRTAAFPDAYNVNNSTGVTISLSNVKLNSSSLSKRAGLSAVTGCQALNYWKPNGAPAGLYEYVNYDSTTGKYETTSASDSSWAYYYVTTGHQLITPANSGVCYGGQRYYKAVRKCPSGSYCSHTGNMSCTNGETYTDPLPNTSCTSLTTSGFYYSTDSTGASKPEQCFGWATPGTTVLTPYADSEDCPVGYYCPGGEYPEGGYGADEQIYYGSVSASTAKCPDGFTSNVGTQFQSSCYCTTVLDKNGLYGTIFGVAGTTNVTNKLNYGVANSLPKASTLVAENATFTGYWSTTKPTPESAFSLDLVPDQFTSITVTEQCPARLYAIKQGVSVGVTLLCGAGTGTVPNMSCYANSGECFLPSATQTYCTRPGYVLTGWENTGDDCLGANIGEVFDPGADVSVVGADCYNSYYTEFTALWTENGVMCAPGYYAKQGESTCNNKCGYGYYCPGGAGTTANGDFGRYSCSDLFSFESTTDKSHASISSDSNTASKKTQCYVQSSSGYRMIRVGITDDGVVRVTTDLSPANYAWYQDRLYYDATAPVLSNAMTCAADLGDVFIYSDPGSNSACYAQIVLDKNGGSGTINGASGTDSAIQRVLNDTYSQFPATTPLSSSIYNFTNQWGTDSECSGTTYTPGTDYYFYAGDSVPEKLYACRTAKKFTCTAGTYLPANSVTCADCDAGWYCSGGTYTYDEHADKGILECPPGFTSSVGQAAERSDCYIEIGVGQMVEINQATGAATQYNCNEEKALQLATYAGIGTGHYCPGGTYYYTGPGVIGYEQCPDTFDDAPSTISSQEQCTFTLQPGDSLDSCSFTGVGVFDYCYSGNYYCPGYSVTVADVEADNVESWCEGSNDDVDYSGSNTCPANSTVSADQTHCTCNYGYQVSNGAATITSKTQTCVPVSVTVSAGYYLPAGSLTPVACTKRDVYCPGATCTFNAYDDCGRESCPTPEVKDIEWDTSLVPYTSTTVDVTLNSWDGTLTSITQCAVSYGVKNQAGVVRLEGIRYDEETGYTNAQYLTPYYVQLNPGYYLHTPYSSTYCTTGNANGMYYQFAEKCPANSYCPGLKTMPACDGADSVMSQFGYTSFTYGDDLGMATCAWGTNGNYVYSDASAPSKDYCYLTTSSGFYVANPGAGQVTCIAGSVCIGGAKMYYGDESGGDFAGGIEPCPLNYPESAPGSQSCQSCYVTLAPGEYVPSTDAGVAPCPASDYCPGGDKIYLFVSEGGDGVEYGGNIPCPAGYRDNTDLGKYGAKQCTIDVPGGYYIGTQYATEYTATNPGYYQPTAHSVGYGQISADVDVLGYEYIACSGQDKYQDLTAQTSCKTATDGFYTTKAGEICSDGVACTGQAECEIGHYCTAGVRSACDGADKYQNLTGQTSCNTVSWGYYTTKDGELCADSEGNGSACTGQTQCEGGYYCTARTGVRAACPDALTHKRTTQFASTNSSLVLPTVTLDMLQDLTSTSVTNRVGLGDVTGCQVLSWYKAKTAAEGGKASLYEYAMYSTETKTYSNTSGWGYMSVLPGYYLSDPSSCGAYAYYHVLNECESGQYCPGKDSVACNSSNQATVHTETFGLETCPTNYGASPARATAENQCYLTTTAGTYVAEPYATPVTCPGGSWCPSAQVNYGETGVINACPVPSEHAMTTFPSSWYPKYQNGGIVSDVNMSLNTGYQNGIAFQTGRNGAASVNQCYVNYYMNSDVASFNVEGVAYNESTGLYDDVDNSNRYLETGVNAGYHLGGQYSETWCDTASNRMRYEEVYVCPAGSYCPGVSSSSALCSAGTYNDTLGLNSCPATYPNSLNGSSNKESCWRTLSGGGTAILEAYGEPVTCPANHVCPNLQFEVYYGDLSPIWTCRDGLSEFYPYSEPGADSENDCFADVSVGYYVKEQYDEVATSCPSGEFTDEIMRVFYGSVSTCTQCTNAPENAEYDAVTGWTNANCPWTCNDGYNQTVDANGNPMCGQMCTVPGMNYIKSSTGLSIPLYSSKGAGWARAIGVKLPDNDNVCYGRLEQVSDSTPSGALRVNVGETTYYAVE